MINVVVTMGGLGSRFRKAGYTVPKYQIEVRGQTLFSWSMISLKYFWQEQFIFLVRMKDKADSFIRQQCQSLGIQHIKVVELDRLTCGQAETAMLAEAVWLADAPMLIYNIDTYVDAGEMNSRTLQGDGCIPCFTAKGTHWSFVRLDESGHVVEVREKKRISNNCSLGAYYFRSCNLYASLYREFYCNQGHAEHGEQYIAPMYNLLLQREGDVRIQNIDSRHVHVLGTPAELQVFRIMSEKNII